MTLQAIRKQNRVTVKAFDTLLLDDPKKITYLAKGQADLCFVKVEADNIMSYRIPLAEFADDALLFGYHAKTAGQQWALLLVAKEDLELYQFDSQQLHAENKKNAEQLADLISKWFEHLGNWLSLQTHATQFTLVTEGSAELTSGTRVKTEAEIYWFTVQSGELSMANTAINLDPELHYPISKQLWYRVGSDCQLKIISFDDWLSRDDWLKELLASTKVLIDSLLMTELTRAKDALDMRLSQNKSDVSKAFSALHGIFSYDEELAETEHDFDQLQQCISTVMQRLGLSIKPYHYEKAYQEESTDYSEEIELIARANKIRVREVTLAQGWWKKDSGPLLAFLRDTVEPVVLLPLAPNGYELYNVNTKTRTKVDASINQSLLTFGYMFYRPFQAVKLNFKRIIHFAFHRLRRDLTTIVLMGLLGGLLGLVIPVVTGYLFDTIIPAADLGQLTQLVIALIAAPFASSAFILTRNIAMLRIEGKTEKRIQAAIWDRILQLPVPFFRQFNAGDLAIRANAINAIRQKLSGTVINTAINSIFTVFSLLLLFYYSVKLALAAVLLTLVITSVFIGFGFWKLKYERLVTAAERKVSGNLLQYLNGITKIRGCGLESKIFSLWAQLFNKQRSLTFKAEMINNILNSINSAYSIIASVVIFGAVVYALTPGTLSTGSFLAFNAAFINFMSSVLALSDAAIQTIEVGPLYESAEPILKTLPETSGVKKDPGELTGHIELSDIHFSYDQEGPEILHNISLTIEPGEFVAVVGTSGSGKSTLLRILLGFETPDSGAVFYDDKDLADLDITRVRTQLGVVLQNGALLVGDIFSNIVGAASLTLDNAWQATEMVGFAEEIRKMPMQMHTFLGPSGGGLSGGQQQRMLLARAVVHNPKILFLDEATSALDNASQTIVTQSLDGLHVSRLVIAHRLSTIINANKIVVLDKGRIIQVGSFDELISQAGTFRELAKRQLPEKLPEIEVT